MQIPDVQYARSGDAAIACQVVGEGPIDLVFVRGALADLLAAWEEPRFVQHVEGLASFARVLLFDKRGSGLSDPVRQVPTLEARMDDVRAVLDATVAGPAVLWSGHEGTRLAVLFAARIPNGRAPSCSTTRLQGGCGRRTIRGRLERMPGSRSLPRFARTGATGTTSRSGHVTTARSPRRTRRSWTGMSDT